MSWHDAQAYIDWLKQKTGKSYRLPSEAEWEYAARGGTQGKYYWGNDASHEYANYGTDNCCGGLARGQDRWVNTAPVGQFDANVFGLLDMSGNVWEWVQDEYHASYKGAPSNGSARESGNGSRRVLRGGGWFNDAPVLRVANRVRNGASNRVNNTGFRLAEDLPR